MKISSQYHQEVPLLLDCKRLNPVLLKNTDQTKKAALLVGETTGGGFEILGGDKTHCFISRNKSLQLINTKA
jgi:hypothetical protein